MKKGQVSMFVIVMLVMVVIFLIFFLRPIQNADKQSIRPVEDFVHSCIQETSEDAVYYIGQSGGYVTVPQPNLENGIAFYLHEGKNFMPSKETIEREISSYVEFSLPFCINDFQSFSDFTIDDKEFTITTEIQDENVIFNLEYPLTIQKGETTHYLESFSAEVPVRLGFIYKAISESMDEQMKRKDAICMNCNYAISEKYNITFDFLDTNETNQLLVIVRDSQSALYDERYAFNYAIKLDEGNNE